MAGKTKAVSKSELARRKAQAAKDKRGTASAKQRSTPMSVARTKSNKKTGPKGGTSSQYARLVLDPCNAPFTQSNMPGSGGAQAIRVPFRQIAYVPSAGVGCSGAAVSGFPSCDTLFAVLTPHAMVSGGGPSVLGIYGAVNETTVANGTSGSYIWTDPPGLSGLNSYVGEMRPAAACVKISCMATDTVNSGLFFGYEGTARQMLIHFPPGTDYNQPFFPIQTAQNLIFNGQTSGKTYNTFEARINYPSADPEWQEFRQLSAASGQSTGVGNAVTRSPDGTDPDFSQMPVAVVGVTSATPGARYLIEGVVVYEWQPKITVGVIAPIKKIANPAALQSAAKVVQNVAAKTGGMLVGAIANYATGGASGAALGMLQQAMKK